jgi:hypothetical protein
MRIDKTLIKSGERMEELSRRRSRIRSEKQNQDGIRTQERIESSDQFLSD